MRILVTGATGFLAGHLIPALQQRGHTVRALVVPSADASGLEARGVSAFRGDVREPDSLTAAMRDADAVFHLAAAIGTWRPLEEYQAVNVTGTKNVCRAALVAGVTRLVHVSTTSVYEHGLREPVKEDSPLRPLPDPYALTKAAGDKLVQRMIAEQGLPACIVRTSTIFGPGDRLNFGRIADRLLAQKAIVIGSGRNTVPFVYVADVVQGLLLALERKQAVGQIYNIDDDNCPTQKELLKEIAEQVGARPPRIHVPRSLLYSAAYVAERVAALTHSSQPLVTRHGVALYGTNNRYSIDKARKELGYKPQVPLREGIRLTAAWYGENAAGPHRLSAVAAV
ncbi:MAG TPA: NAD-dependent epimerase/dehydratase family protein [Candidatus Dormibacteraeota bacterium]